MFKKTVKLKSIMNSVFIDLLSGMLRGPADAGIEPYEALLKKVTRNKPLDSEDMKRLAFIIDKTKESCAEKGDSGRVEIADMILEKIKVGCHSIGLSDEDLEIDP